MEESDVAFDALPGGDLVRKGLADLEARHETVESLLVSIGAPRLRRGGLIVAGPFEEPEARLYRHLAVACGDDAHSRFNGLIRRLVRFERALACARK